MKKLLLVAVATVALCASAQAGEISSKYTGLWCSAPIPQGAPINEWRYYQRGGCSAGEVEGSRWLVLYPNGDYRETATHCRVTRTERGWSDYRCKIEGLRMPELRYGKFLIADDKELMRTMDPQ